MRNMHEAQLHDESSFVTLTYAPEHLPAYGALVPEHFTKFIKDLKYSLSELRVNPDTGRKKRYWPKLRYFMCGEYGEGLERPHYHAIIFGYWPKDAEYWKTTNTGHKLYISPSLEKIWGRGFTPVGSVTYESAGYVSRYVMKKAKGSKKSPEEYLNHYERQTPDGTLYYLPPEYARMSRRPGIGKEWYDKFKDDVYPDDEVVVQGKVLKPPRYYDKLLEEGNPELYEIIKSERMDRGRKNWSETTPKRLATKEIVAESKIKSLRRPYEEKSQ